MAGFIPKDPQGKMLLMCSIGGIMFVLTALLSPLPQMFKLVIGMIGIMVTMIPGTILYIIIKRRGFMMFLEPQGRGEVIALYHSASGLIVPFKCKQLLERYLSFVGGYGRIRYTKKASYWFLGRRVVHAVQGLSHTVPPWVAFMSNVLVAKGYKSFGEAIIGEYGADLAGLTGLERDMALRIFKKEGIKIPSQPAPAEKSATEKG